MASSSGVLAEAGKVAVRLRFRDELMQSSTATSPS